MKEILNKLFKGHFLEKEEATTILKDISAEKYNEASAAAFMTAFNMRDITPAELAGFRDALIDLAVKVDLKGVDSIDIVGTGGDGKNTFNISTLSSFVVAGAGYKVTKHGNYGVSSVSGSSNVLEHLGYQFTNDHDTLMRQLDEAGICFFHAPKFHPAMKFVAPIRRAMGVRTFFNLLGPLVNPAQPKRQLLGVSEDRLVDLYHLSHEGVDKEYTIVYAQDGYDEISLTSTARIRSNNSEETVDADYFGMKTIDPIEIHGGDSVESAAKIFRTIVSGQGTESQTNVVLANSALAIQCFDRTKSIADCVEEARESIKSGSANKALEKLTSLN